MKNRLKNICQLFAAGLIFLAMGVIFHKVGFAQTEIITQYQEKPKEAPEDIVYRVAREEGISWLLAVRIIDCESRWDKYFQAVMKDGSKDRGLLAFNTKYYPEVSADCVFDPECSVREFAKEVKAGHLNNWLCTKTLGLVK